MPAAISFLCSEFGDMKLTAILLPSESGCWGAARPTGYPVMEPPQMINAGELVLRRWEAAWADEAAAAVRESLPELAPFLPWATAAHDVEASRVFIEKSGELWDQGTTFNYGIFTAVGDLVGAIGLMTRMGPGVLEIGYWVAADRAGGGIGTTAARALTEVARSIEGCERTEIHCDEGNVASAAIPRRLGYRLERTEHRERTAPGETERNQVWVLDLP